MWQNTRRGSRRHYGDAYAYILAFQTAAQLLQQRRWPPVTLALIAVNVAVHLRPGPLDEVLPYTGDVCLNPALFLRTWDWRRLVLSAFWHADDTHLIYNMVSLLWKGMELEAQLGSARFATTTAALLLLSHGALVAVSLALSDLAGVHGPFVRDCAVGFSAVLFGLKTLLNAQQPTLSRVGGVLLPTKYAAWAELLLIQLLVPQASFLGHLCGILAGCTLLHAPPLVHCVLPLLPLGALLGRRGRFWGSGHSGLRNHRHGPTGTSRGRPGRGAPDEFWACSVCTFHNRLEAEECEMCGGEPGVAGTRPSTSTPHPLHQPPSAPPLADESEDGDWVQVGRGPHAEGTASVAGGQGPAAPAGSLTPETLRALRLQRFQRR